MSFDAELFGQAMGEAIRKAIEPLHARIAELEEKASKSGPYIMEARNGKDGADGKDCDMEAVKAMVLDAIKTFPAPADGKDGRDGADGKQGPAGADGQKGADGLGLAGAIIDRDGALQITLTNGEVKSLGNIVGKDGANGTNGRDGVDGIGFDAFEMEYLDETHEVLIKASSAGRTKELRYPAGGIRPAGYWREGTKAQAGEAWVHDGSLWIACKSTPTKPVTGTDDWIIAARKGRDGERGAKGVDGSPPAPIKLKG